MSKSFKYIGIVFCLALLFVNPFDILAQGGMLSYKILTRDSLDFKKNDVGIKSPNVEFSPIPYKGGVLYISNKKTSSNRIGLNKVYWALKNQLGKENKDSLIKEYKLNNDFTAKTSNDNNILFHYARKKDLKNLNDIEKEFANFNPEAPFTVNEFKNEIIYSKLSTHKIKGAFRWELWQAELKNGKVKNEKRLVVEDAAADYLYPHLADSGKILYFSSNRKGGQGGYDIYTLENENGIWNKKPTSVVDVNTKFNEIYPTINPNVKSSILYTSDKTGGLGGYDVYQYNYDSKMNHNLGYPINSISNELGLAIVNNEFYVATKNDSSADIKALTYNPILIPVNGSITYANDSSLAPFKKIYVYDKDENKLVDSIYTNAQSQYQYNVKLNRNYRMGIKNEEGQIESFDLLIGDKLLSNNFVSEKLLGKSPSQIKAATLALLITQEKMKSDSLASLNLNDKFIVKFGFDQSKLIKYEQLILDSLLIKLKNLPTKYIIIGAFTDCIGTFKYNYKLSIKRAQYVVDYLVKNGLDINRVVSNGYSKKYTLTPCETTFSKSKQQNSRRAEIVLSDNKNTNWAALEAQRGSNYYSVYNAASFIKSATTKNDNVAKINKTIPTVVKKKDTLTIAKVLPVINKKDTLVKVIVPKIIKKDTLVKVNTPVVVKVVKKDTVVKINKIIPIVVKKKDTIKIAKVLPKVIKKDTLVKVIAPMVIKKDTLVKVNTPTVFKLFKKDTVVKIKKIIPIAVNKKDTITIAKALPVVIKKDTLVKVIAPLVTKKDTQVKVNTPVVVKLVKKDTIAKIKNTIPIIVKKKDTISIAKALPVVIKKDTLAKVIAPVAINVVKKDTVVKINKIIPIAVKKKDTTLIAKAPPVIIKKDTIAKVDKPVTKKEKVIVATSINNNDEDLSQSEIIAALDSLAKLKREQERIVDYLTKRINKKPIEISVSSDSVTIEIYDNAIHDKDSVSIIYNNRIIVDRQELKVNKPIKFKLKVDSNKFKNELIMVAENLGAEPPNTAVMFVTEKSGKKQQVMLSTDMKHNEVIYFIRIGKQ